MLADSSEPGFIYIALQSDGPFTTKLQLDAEALLIGVPAVAVSASNPWNGTVSIGSNAGFITDNAIIDVYTVDASDNVSVTPATFTTDLTAPTVTAGNISINPVIGSPSGTLGQYIPGNQVTAKWKDTGGDNNPDVDTVTFDFTQFGGGVVGGSNTAGVWSASYTFVAGSVDAANRNVIVTATDSHFNPSPATTDNDNINVDVSLPVITVAKITEVSTPGGANSTYVIGNTLKYHWDAVADGNTDISGVTFDFSQFGGGSSVPGTLVGGIWEGSYVITALSPIDATTLKVTITATDDASNQKTQQDDQSIKMDNVIPTLSASNIHITNSGTGTAGTFIIGNTVNAQWNNTNTGAETITRIFHPLHLILHNSTDPRQQPVPTEAIRRPVHSLFPQDPRKLRTGIFL